LETDRQESSQGGPELTIVIPAYNAAHHLERVIPAAQRAADGAPVLVVDPGSDDGTPEVAEMLGARVIRLGRRAGPAEARNVGSREVETPVILFIDSDCVASPDVVRIVREHFAAEPELVTLTGSYDAEPPDPGFFSQYMNLRHHYTHQIAQREPATFWAGCGAVQREAFEQVGGFDAERFPMPQIEDIELGLRMGKLGKTRLDPALNVTHLKRWTGRSVVETDVKQRAIPWSRLILESGDVPNDLNLRTSQRVAAALSPLALLAPVAAFACALLGSAAGVALCAALVLASVLLSRGMLGFFRRERGWAFATGAWAFHQLHLFYSALTFVFCTLEHRLGSRKQVPA
jgi:GT2 family glycosyltransferase